MADPAVTLPDALPAGALADVQALVTTGWSRLPYATFLFVRLPDSAEEGRRWLAEVAAEVAWADGAEPERAPPTRLALALTTRGLARLGVPPEVVDRFPQEAKLGMRQRARILGDRVDHTDTPTEWTLPLEACGALVMIYAPTEEARAAAEHAHEQRVRGVGGGVLVRERSAAWKGSEPFGFADGLSQPVIKGVPVRPGAVRGPRDEVPAGEIVLGYRNAYGQLPASPRWDDLDLGKHGSYLVFRKLEQDVAGFWRWFDARAAELAGQPPVPADRALAREWLAARAMGRWRNGSPVVLHPDAPGPAGTNDFQYLELDPDGERCPIGAHVRRANPRDARGGSADESWKVVNRHRLLRRGRAYGEAPTVEAALAGADATAAVGLLFVSLQASIARGFEFVQQIWNGNPGFHGLHGETDPITGPGGCPFTIPARPVRLRLDDLPRFVTARGGEYFFLPSRSALDRIAAG